MSKQGASDKDQKCNHYVIISVGFYFISVVTGSKRVLFFSLKPKITNLKNHFAKTVVSPIAVS